MANATSTLPPLPLPDGVSEDYVDCTASTGLKFHVLKSGEDAEHKKPLLLLLHGFPELAFSWHHIMPALAAAGFYVVAPDHRGYGRTTGWDNSSFHEVDLAQFSSTSLVRDQVALVYALGYTKVRCVIGHDAGAAISAMCALMRPDFFQSCVQMSHPFAGSPSLPFNVARQPETGAGNAEDVHQALADLSRPRKHYKWYNATPGAAQDWDNPQQGMNAFLRGYFHLKSADWKQNEPFSLKGWTAEELAKMPNYYILPLEKSMTETVALDMQGEDANATTHWLPEDKFEVYVQEWSRTGFQGGLNFYRIATEPAQSRDLLLFAGKKIEVPCTFISGAQDWGNHQQPGVVENLHNVCTRFLGPPTYIQGASHWVQQEQPEQTLNALLEFLRTTESMVEA